MPMRYRYPAVILAAIFLSGVTSLRAQVYPKREFRGAWLATVANIDWPRSPADPPDLQKTQLTTLLDALHASGISSVIFQVRPECDAFYQSSIEPWSYYLTGTQGLAASYDPLQFALEEAHKRGMELHAWFNPYRAVRVIGLFPVASNHVSVLHPDWILTFPADNQKLLDPGLPQVRNYVSRVVSDIVRRYDVDGLHADDYFYPYSGITKQDSATFANYSRGITDIGEWRRDNVNLLMTQIEDSVKAMKPWVKFGMSPFGIWKNGVPPGIKGLDAYNEIYGDAMAWLHHHSIDYLTPQLYWKIGGSQDYAALMAWWADSVAAYGRHLYTGNEFVTTYSTAELPNQVAMNRGNPKVGGQILFSANGIPSDALAFADSLKSHQYRYPALSPVMAWKDTTPPYMPRGIRYAQLPGAGPAALQWDLPIIPPSGDTAYRYVVYRFDHRPAATELAAAQNILSVEGRRWFLPPAPPLPSGPYYFVVTALSRNFVESDTSNIVIVGPPPAPLLLSPVSGVTNTPESLVVSWHSSPLTSAYQLQVGADSTFGAAFIVNESSITDTTRLVRGFQGQTFYYWRVRASSGGGTSPWSAVYTFRTGFPASPGPVFPPNFQVDLPVFLSLRWNASPSGITSSFRVQLARSADFVSLVMDSSGVTDTTLGAPPLQYFTLYFWRVRGTNSVGTSPWSPGYKFRTVQVTGIEPVPGVPSTFGLDQNYPNPFNPTTIIGYQLPFAANVTVIVYDMLGQEVERLVDGMQAAGRHTVPWNGSNHASGVYLVRMNSATFTSTKRLLLLK